MALTREMIAANAVLAALTDEQITALETLSKNDENTVIGNKVGEIYREFDNKISTITGIARNGDEKTYNYFERAANVLKDSAKGVDDFKKQVDDLTKEKARLEKAIADGTADAETKKQLNQAKADLTAITNQYNTLKTEHDKAKETHQMELFGIQVKNDLTIATNGLNFKKDLPQSVTAVLLDQTVNKIKGLSPEYIDDGKGGKQLVFKDETGAIMRNPENQLNPYTATDLVQKELKTLGVLDEGRKAAGGGTNPPAGGAGGNGGNGGGGSTIDVTSAKTRVEANDAITNGLLSQGLTKGSDEWQTAMNQAWTDNNVAALPEK